MRDDWSQTMEETRGADVLVHQKPQGDGPSSLKSRYRKRLVGNHVPRKIFEFNGGTSMIMCEHNMRYSMNIKINKRL